MREQPKKPKRVVCHFAIVLEVLFHKWFPVQRAKPQEKKKQTKQPHEDMRRKETLRERFKKTRPLNHAHIFLRKDKQLETRTTKREILMS